MRLKPESFAFTVLLAAMSALPPLAIDMGLPGIPAIEMSFSNAAERGALTLSVFLAGFAITPLIAGALADRFGRKSVMAWGLIGFAATAAASGLAWSFNSLLAFRLLQGLASGVCVVLPLAIIRDLFEGAGARTRLSQIVSVIGIAPIAAPIVGGVMILLGGWRLIFFAQAFFALAILLFMMLSLDESLKPQHRRSLRPGEILHGYVTVLRHRKFRDYTAVYSLGFGCLFAYISSSPAVFVDRFGLSEQVFSLLFAIGAAGIIVGSSIGTHLSKRETSSHRMMVYSLVGMALASLIALGLATTHLVNAWTLTPLVLLAVSSFGILAPTATHESIEPLPHVAGAASGMGRCIQMIVGAAASAAIAPLLTYVPAEIAMTWLMTACSLAALGAFALHVWRVRRHEAPRPCEPCETG